MNNYKPLPDYLTIKKSNIHGLGLYALKHIPKFTHIGITHYNIKGLGIIRTPLGGFYNHSENANCEKYLEVGDDLNITWSMLVATKDIKAGEELTVNYTLYKIDENKNKN